jgi:hypothetical protein
MLARYNDSLDYNLAVANPVCQICLNVNHVLVDPAVKDELVARLSHHFGVFMGEPDKEPPYYTAITNQRNFDRLADLLQKTKGQVIYGGNRNRDSLFFSPTIVLVDGDDILLSSEISVQFCRSSLQTSTLLFSILQRAITHLLYMALPRAGGETIYPRS